MKRIPWKQNKITFTRKKKGFLLFLLSLTICFSYILLVMEKQDTAVMVMGGTLKAQCVECEDSYYDQRDFESYFRPSKLPVLNTRIPSLSFFDPYSGKKAEEITLPDVMADTPENVILNYYSILRDASNPVEGKSAGCGTIGNAQIPYPISYQFLSSQYQKNLSYNDYLKTYENILHINLIKYHQVPTKTQKENGVRYFVELETIEGTDKETGVFAYYFGFVDLVKEGNQYKISDMYYFGENFLCAPYHGWQWDAEGNVNIRYGDWCKLIKGDIKKTQNDYNIRIFFDGTDGFQYCIVFFQLTNGTDLEVAQYRRIPGGKWKAINMNLEDCLENKINAFSIIT